LTSCLLKYIIPKNKGVTETSVLAKILRVSEEALKIRMKYIYDEEKT